jgi:ribonuclease HII
MDNICGIDEAGRGPWAGPLVVAGVIFKENNKIDGLTDSKKLTPKKREILYDKIVENSFYHIVFVDNTTIDEIGLSKSIQNSLKQIMNNLKADRYIFDGNTTFNIDNITAIIKADLSIAEVSAASILAKVSRDRYMQKKSLEYPNYQFDKHKGYITKLHKELVLKYGLSNLHRQSYKVKGFE